MMRSIQILFLLLAVVCCRSIAAGPMLKATFSSTTMYYGIGPNSDKSIVAEVTIATPRECTMAPGTFRDIVKEKR
ncbi:membrane protein [Salmonella enterica subsp. enterica]|uniref:Membrane protein n=1 Tax=Salmonella enterica I TaxID=59201 RepID=A0A379WG98_SALET|nr:membrane protein [Salmonella enterica subsp. enterica]